MTSVIIIRRCASALAVFAITTFPCTAEEFAAAEVLDEIVVTADYRERSVAELPLSLTVLDEQSIRAQAVQHFEELVSLVPNMNWSGDGHRARYFQIRGVGELAQYQGAPNPSVGFIVDDIDYSGIGTIATLFDIEQIEVLRGPQGTRYGANALAGLVYVRSREPTADFDGRVRLIAGADDEFGGGIAIGGPLSAGGGYRISAHHYQSNGFRDNPFLGRDDTHGRDETVVRAKFNWETANDWFFKLTGMWSDVDNGYDGFAIDNSLTVLSDKPGRDAQESIGASFKAVWNGASSFSLTSITSIADSDIDFSFDADWGNALAWAPVTYDFVSFSDRQRRTLSQEFRVSSADEARIFGDTTDWLLGVYVNRLDEDLSTVNLGEYFDPGSGFADSPDDRLTSEFEAFNSALFGQLDISVGDTGTFSLGLRLEHRSVDYVDSNGLALGPSETMLGGELGYRHEFGGGISGFVTVSRGFKAGGFNLGFVPEEDQREFEQESLWNVELGVRSVLADGRLTLNGSAFYSIRRDQQVETSFQVNPNDPASFVFFTANASRGETAGLEADIRWRPAESWELFASLGLLRAEFDEFSAVLVELSGRDISGRDQAHAPRYTLAAGAEYRHPAGYFARVDVSAKDEFYFDVSHDQKSESYTLTNARFGYEADRWTAELYARNLFDREYAVRGFFFGNEPPDFPPALYVRLGDPRQIGLTLDWRF